MERRDLGLRDLAGHPFNSRIVYTKEWQSHFLILEVCASKALSSITLAGTRLSESVSLRYSLSVLLNTV